MGEEGSPHLADLGLVRTLHDHSHSAPDTLVWTLTSMAQVPPFRTAVRAAPADTPPRTPHPCRMSRMPIPASNARERTWCR
ncbi:hypothetical protein [Streptomyces sp. WM4235]|uniref:hypothetical protein n=1 Tax=Streptomyces sp. WM4235 TaxID=1415551 RepID=UPI003B633193